MSNLEAVNWDLEDDEKEDIPLRRKKRREFAESLACFPQTVRRFQLLYPYTSPTNHDFQPAGANDYDTVLDPLSIALRRVAQQCTTFTIDGSAVLDAGIFWPQQPLAGPHTAPYWSLRGDKGFNQHRFYVRHVALWPRPTRPRDQPPTPLVDWVPGVLTGDELQYFYRESPDQEYRREWCMAAARAAAHMPRSRLLVVEWILTSTKCESVYDILGGKLPRFYCASMPVLHITAEIEVACGCEGSRR